MAEDDTEEQDPSIEEILDSIRQIISDDDEEGGEEEAAPEEAAEPEEEPEPEEDIVELTEEVEAEEPAEPEPEPEEEPEPIEEVAEEPEPEPEPEEEPEPIEVIMEDSEPEEASEAPPEDSILTNVAEAATLEGFGEVVRKTQVEHNGITLEEIVRTELRPLLKDWLDDHLPSIIERLVQEELERLSKRALEE